MSRCKEIVFTLLCIFLLSGFLYAKPIQEAISLQEAFIDVSKEAGPAVVSISTEHIERYQTVYRPFAQFKDDFFKDFFNDFLVVGPQMEFKRIGLGSGVIIDKDGHILTNEHVVHGTSKITVTLPDGREFEGRLKGFDEYSDVAIIKIDSKEELPFVRLGDSDDVQIGQWAIAIGNPYGFGVENSEPTVTVGVVSALNRSLPRTNKRVREYKDLIQTDAAINPGNSGGPLLDIYGDVVGINVAILTHSGGSEGIGFAIPINISKKVMEDLKRTEDVKPEDVKCWSGIKVSDITDEIQARYKLPPESGVIVIDVEPFSPAGRSGIREGDVIHEINRIPIRNMKDYTRTIKKLSGDVLVGTYRGYVVVKSL